MTVAEIAEAIFDGPHATPKGTASGPVFLGISSLVGGKLDLSRSGYLSEEDYLRWTRRVTPAPGDLVFSYETRLGEAALIPEGLRCCLGRRMGLIRPNRAVVTPQFLLYAYLAPGFQETIRQHTIPGSTVDRIPLLDLPNFPIVIPPLPTQRAIAEVLGALDDKIESNHRINRQLKEFSELRLRQAVGSPVGELIGSDENIRCVQVGGSEIAIVKPGLGASNIGEEYEYLATAVVFDNSYERGEFGTLASLPSRANMQPGDDRVWFARMKSTEKNLWTPSEFNQKWSCMVLSTGFLGFQSADSRLAPLLMTAVRCQEFGETKDQLCNGTTMQSLNNDAARSIWFRVPANEFKLAELSSDIRSNLLLEARLNDESKILKSVRDALIPELLSGRLHVRDAEKVVERLS